LGGQLSQNFFAILPVLYLSNHTLEGIGNDWGNESAPDDVKLLLALNKHPDEHVAIHKILKSHIDFDVEPSFEWNLKALPLLVSWFERVITLVHVDEHKWISDESLEAIQSRKLSTVYKFIRGLPHMTTGDDYRSRKNPTKFAFLRRKISNRCLSHGMALLRLFPDYWIVFHYLYIRYMPLCSIFILMAVMACVLGIFLVHLYITSKNQ
jgi:hypothetical protein